jgi:hypothetical protein
MPTATAPDTTFYPAHIARLTEDIARMETLAASGMEGTAEHAAYMRGLVARMGQQM